MSEAQQMVLLDTMEDFEPAIPNIPDDVRYVAIDTETDGLDIYNGNRLFGISVGTKHGAHYLPVRAKTHKNLDEQQTFAWLRDLAKNPKINWLMYNATFDLRAFYQEGIEFAGPVLDVMVLAQLQQNQRAKVGLKELARLEGYETLSEEALKKYRKKNQIFDYSLLPSDLIIPYAIEDARLTYELFVKLYSKLSTAEQKLFSSENDVTKAIFRMENRGIRIDVDKLSDLEDLLLAEKNRVTKELTQEGISPSQRSTIIDFIIKHDIKVGTTTAKGDISTSEYALKEADHPILNKVLEYREYEKLHGTYAVGLLRAHVNGVIHAQFHQSGTVTGRLSCSEPNLQNQPTRSELAKSIRKVFIPREGYNIVAIDLSQIEMRLFAYLSKDPNLYKAYLENIATDAHQATADIVGIPRRAAKTINFAILFGAGAYKIAKQLSDLIEGMTVEKAYKIIDAYHERIPSVGELSKDLEEQLKRKGYITNLYGRRYYIPSGKEYKGINYAVQGSAADLFKKIFATSSMRLMQAYSDTHVVLQVHDEMMIETPKEEAISALSDVKRIMEYHPNLTIPILTEANVFNPTWGEKVLWDYKDLSSWR